MFSKATFRLIASVLLVTLAVSGCSRANPPEEPTDSAEQKALSQDTEPLSPPIASDKEDYAVYEDEIVIIYYPDDWVVSGDYATEIRSPDREFLISIVPQGAPVKSEEDLISICDRVRDGFEADGYTYPYEDEVFTVNNTLIAMSYFEAPSNRGLYIGYMIICSNPSGFDIVQCVAYDDRYPDCREILTDIVNSIEYK